MWTDREETRWDSSSENGREAERREIQARETGKPERNEARTCVIERKGGNERETEEEKKRERVRDSYSRTGAIPKWSQIQSNVQEVSLLASAMCLNKRKLCSQGMKFACSDSLSNSRPDSRFDSLSVSLSDSLVPSRTPSLSSYPFQSLTLSLSPSLSQIGRASCRERV